MGVKITASLSQTLAVTLRQGILMEAKSLSEDLIEDRQVQVLYLKTLLEVLDPWISLVKLSFANVLNLTLLVSLSVLDSCFKISSNLLESFLLR